MLAGLHARSDRSGSVLSVDPALPDWLPTLTLHNVRAGRGAISLRIAGGTVEILSNSTGFRVETPPTMPARGKAP
jgi:hypothetical protein